MRWGVLHVRLPLDLLEALKQNDNVSELVRRIIIENLDRVQEVGAYMSAKQKMLLRNSTIFQVANASSVIRKKWGDESIDDDTLLDLLEANLELVSLEKKNPQIEETTLALCERQIGELKELRRDLQKGRRGTKPRSTRGSAR